MNLIGDFSNIITIKNALLFDSFVRIAVCNPIGEIVKELVNNQKAAGYLKAIFESGNLLSGVYFFSIEAIPLNGYDQFFEAGKMILLT